jgi:hypothetical protein
MRYQNESDAEAAVRYNENYDALKSFEPQLRKAVEGADDPNFTAFIQCLVDCYAYEYCGRIPVGKVHSGAFDLRILKG